MCSNSITDTQSPKKSSKRHAEDYPIDIVIAWVDDADQQWCALKREYETTPDPTAADDSDERYRDWGFLRYLLRGIEKFMPWIRTVHLVTCGQSPVWLNKAHPKLHLVNHTDYIPAEYLPTFNSHTIELNFHRIEGLSEHFIYLNDDMLFTALQKRTDYFRDGFPVDMLALQPVVANPANEVMSHIYLNNSLVIARHFKKYDNMKSQPHSYFNLDYPVMHLGYNILEKVFPLYTGFYTPHGASPLCKSAYRELWEKEFDILDATSRHRFRDSSDVSQYLIREWQKQSGCFKPSNVVKHFKYINLSDDYKPVIKALNSKKYSSFCLNDSNYPLDFDKVKDAVIGALDNIMPDKSEYEIL